MGYTFTGYNIADPISYEQLIDNGFQSIGNTCIVPLEIDGYKHFTVFRDFDRQYVYLGDPSYGNICLSLSDFTVTYLEKVIFVVEEQPASSSSRAKQATLEFVADHDLDTLFFPDTL